MRFLTKRLRDKDEEDLVIGDWKFAAMVIDRYNTVIDMAINMVIDMVIDKSNLHTESDVHCEIAACLP